MGKDKKPENSKVTITVDHWRAHPDWRPGRHYLTTFLVFGEEPSFVEAALAVQADLADAPVAVCPPATLHQTIQGVGWEDELTDEDILAVRKNMAVAVAGVLAFQLKIRSLQVGAEGIWFVLQPREPLINLRRVLHKAITSALGRTAPGDPNDLFPHMTVAYCNAASDAASLYRAEERHRSIVVKPIQVHSVDLIWLRREPTFYTWDLVDRLSFSDM